MTEEEWLRCGDPTVTFDFLCVKLGANRRKYGRRCIRLFACACVRGIWELLRQPGSREAVDRVEKYADGLATAQDLASTRAHVQSILAAEKSDGTNDANWLAAQALRDLVADRFMANRYVEGNDYSLRCVISGVAWATLRSQSVSHDGENIEIATRHAYHARLLRDIFGNTFRPIAFDLAWRTSTAVALGWQMYDLRDFAAIPILADALQDVGCDHADILDHCRDTSGVHVRGCWVVDHLLGLV